MSKDNHEELWWVSLCQQQNSHPASHSFSSTGQGDIIGWPSSWVKTKTLWHGVLHRLQDNLGTWSTSSPPFFSYLGSQRVTSLTLFSSFLTATQHFSLPKYIFPKAPQSWLRSSDVSCCEFIRASWKKLFCPGTPGHLHLLQEFMLDFFFVGIQFLAPNIATSRVPFQKYKMVYLKKA